MASVRLAFLGPPLIEVDGSPVHLDTRKATALLAYLSVSAEPVSREVLVTLLWSRYGRAGGHAALRRTLSTLRTAVGREILDTRRETAGLLGASGAWTDIAELRELLARCEGHGHERRAACPRCLPLLVQASRLFRGEFLSGFTLKDSIDFDDWQFFTTDRLRRDAAHVLGRLATCHAAAGDFPAAIDCARRRLELDHLDESAHAALMQLHAWDGNRAAARQQFDECRRMLREELDSPPQESTERLAQSIARGQLPPPPRFAEERRLEEPAAAGTSADAPFAESAACSVLVGMVEQVDGAAAAGAAAAVIPRYNGQVVEASDNGFLALFGDGRFLESNAELAIRAALELRESAEAGRAFRAAVTTGHLSLTARAHAGSGARAFAGRPLPLARLLAARAAAGSVLVDEPTYRHTRSAFSFAPGDSSAPSRHRVLSVAPLSRKSRGPFGPHAEMVGREEEVARLNRAFASTVRGCGQVVVITGEAGIGKSRLVHELYHAVSELLAAGEIRWLEGRCLSPKANIGYWPFIDMVDALKSGAARRAAPQGGRFPSPRGLDELLAAPGSDEEAAGRIEALELATLELLEHSYAGAHGQEIARWSPEQVKHRAFLAVQALFAALARGAPLVLVFEDLHWADLLSLELIESLFDSLRGKRVLLVLVYRNDPDHRSRNLAASAARRRLEDLHEMRLREISPAESSRLLGSLVPPESMSSRVREDILLRCRGNPYFLEELARAAAGAAEEAPEGDLPTDHSTLTDGIKSVVLGRFFNLGEAERNLLQQAAVIGRVFSRRLLELAMAAEVPGAMLEGLEDRELLFVERSVPELEYSFKHVLTQEAVYESIDPVQRRQLHGKVARAYEQLSACAADEFSESLAYHCDRGGEVLKAIDSYYLSGEKARKAYANHAAVAHFSRGLELLRASSLGPRALDRELEFLTSLGVPLVLVKGHHDPSVEAVHLRALAICEERGSAQQRFQVNLGLNRFYPDPRKRLEYATNMLDIARALGDPRLVARAHGMYAESLLFQGHAARMLPHAEEARRGLRPEDSALDLIQFGNDTAVLSFTVESMALVATGRPTDAIRSALAGLERARSLGHAFTLCMSLYYTCLLYYMLGEADPVRPLAEELLALAEREGFALYIENGLVVTGWSTSQPRLILDGLAVPRQRQVPQGTAACMLAEVYQESGDCTSAIAVLQQAMETIPETNAHLWEPELCRLRGEIALAAGEPEAHAGDWLERAFTLSTSQGARNLELRAAMSLYARGPRRGSPEARQLLERVYRGYPADQDCRDLRAVRQMLAAMPG